MRLRFNTIDLWLFITSLAFRETVTSTSAFVINYCTTVSLSNDSETVLFAKKKKGGNKKKGNNKKQSGFEWATSFSLKPFEGSATRELASTACASFEGRTGKPLCEEIEGAADVPKALWSASTACIVVGSVDGEDNVVVKYANGPALETVGLKPDEFEKFIASTGAQGDLKIPETGPVITLPTEMKGDKRYEGGYKKKILREDDEKAGITILDAHRWTIEKSALIDGKFVTETIGVAYAWSSWLEGDETVCRPGGAREEAEDLGALEEKIKLQGEAIRELKEVKGLGNKDQAVGDAVEELLRLKALLQEAS